MPTLPRCRAGVLALVGWLALAAGAAALVKRRRCQQSMRLTPRRWQKSGAAKRLFAWNAVLVTLRLDAAGRCALFWLAGDYHVFGTDKVGQDVLYQVLKSIRTGLVIGTLTTLVMLPLAVLLGIVAGYFRGWVDDVIQYLYTVLNSIPGVLLIAAAVLMMQVIIDTHPEWFATAAERADMRLLALCLILGVTSWTGLCRLLRGETLKLRELEYVQAAQAFGVSSARIIVPPHPAQRDAHRADRDGHGFLRAGAGRGGAVLRRHRRRSDHDQLRHHDQQRAPGTGARADGLVVAGGGLRLHVRAGAGGQPVCRCRARCVRSEGVGHDALQSRDLRHRLRSPARRPCVAVDGVSFAYCRRRNLRAARRIGLRQVDDGAVADAPAAGRRADRSVAACTSTGSDLLALPEADMRDVRGGGMAMIFQEPATSLNPVMTVGEQIAEVLDRHCGLRGEAARERCSNCWQQVGIRRPASGGSTNIRSSCPAA